MTTKWEDPHYLSDLLLRLSSYYSSLALPIATAGAEEAAVELSAKVIKEQSKIKSIKDGNSVALSESTAVIESQQIYYDHISKAKEVRLLFLTRQNLDKCMDAIRSKLSYIKTEKEG